MVVHTECYGRYPTTHVYDVIGRETNRSVTRNPALFNGQGDPALVTTYSYSTDPVWGVITTVTIPKAAAVGDSLSMTRIYDRAGHLVKTTQHLGPTGSGHDIPAQYFYDAAGHVVSILDAANNTITATYDDFGRKKFMSDPDKGNSTYIWDGLGRLLTDTDANGIVRTYVYDNAGRKIARYLNGSSTPDGTWSYEPTAGALTRVVGADGFSRTYFYDTQLRPKKVTTDIPGDQTWAARKFNEQFAYDGNFGRLKQTEYASGEMVRLDYDSTTRAFPIGETQVTLDAQGNAVAGTTYRTVSAFSARGMPAVEKLGNGVYDVAKYDDSTGMARLISSVLPAAGGAVPGPSTVAGSDLTCAAISGKPFRCLDFKYDQFSNLVL